MASKPKVDMNFNAPVYGASGNVEGDLIVNASQQNLNQTLSEIIEIFRDLQRKYPNSTEAEAKDIIEAEFKDIKTQQPKKWETFCRQLLNPERWLNGGKSALSETAKHYLENNVFSKAGIAFLEGFSADED